MWLADTMGWGEGSNIEAGSKDVMYHVSGGSKDGLFFQPFGVTEVKLVIRVVYSDHLDTWV
jgi:hypothetical protein